MFTLSILINSYLITKCFSASWGYIDESEDLNGVSYWKNNWAECGYARQSPIDIYINEQDQCEEPLLLKWKSQLEHYAIRNNGHSLQAIPFGINNAGGGDLSSFEVLHHTNDTNIKLQNSFYNTYKSQRNREYCFDSLHFHWGVDNEHGSEHTINGNGYPLEVHFVHYSCDYEAAGDALGDYSTGAAGYNYDDDNVLAVIGVIFEIGEPNPVLANILDDIIIDGIYQNHAGEYNEKKVLDLYYTEFDLRWLLPESKEIIAYLGSLTTPPCYETVRWHVLKDRMTVSQEQMDKFRLLLGSAETNDSMAPNFRPVQPLNNRALYKCQEDIDNGPELYMDKDDIVEEDDNTLDDEGQMWKTIAIVFACLIVVSLLLCCIGHHRKGSFGDCGVGNNGKSGQNKSKSPGKKHKVSFDHQQQRLSPPYNPDAHQQNVTSVHHL